MQPKNESKFTGYPNLITYECTKKIMKQMEKNICKIKVGKNQGTGFFCKIPFPNELNMLPVMITNNHIINKELLFGKDINIEIDIKEENNIKKIVLKDRIKYTNEEYDIKIIELKDNDDIKNYLELDDNIMNNLIKKKNSKTKEYIDKTIYNTISKK